MLKDVNNIKTVVTCGNEPYAVGLLPRYGKWEGICFDHFQFIFAKSNCLWYFTAHPNVKFKGA